MAEILDFNFYRKFGVILPMRPSEIKNEEEKKKPPHTRKRRRYPSRQRRKTTPTS